MFGVEHGRVELWDYCSCTSAAHGWLGNKLSSIVVADVPEWYSFLKRLVGGVYTKYYPSLARGKSVCLDAPE